jgi:hypothetical protein
MNIDIKIIFLMHAVGQTDEISGCRLTKSIGQMDLMSCLDVITDCKSVCCGMGEKVNIRRRGKYRLY